MSVSGEINTHFIVAHMIARHDTDAQKAHYLPKMATGEIRGSFSMSEPVLGKIDNLATWASTPPKPSSTASAPAPTPSSAANPARASPI
ncbi:acyl-CoA dehydrogenase family protein [Nocardia carnea]|uniref:Acyl-CoA dehydrogenase family protein n=1 Tax=Nocardia carnea TaxID=37328 RepID=A0ABW7TN26_9NOCA|nr:acyl-CoA dehydrogenase family protein [Nocardia carnea]